MKKLESYLLPSLETRGRNQRKEILRRRITWVFGFCIGMGWISYWLPLWEEVGSMKIFDPIKFPGTASWVENFLSQPVINENLPPKDKGCQVFSRASCFYKISHV